MAWVAIAIVAFISIYTFVNVRFRKVEGPHLPYEEAQERSSRFFEFDMNGWEWLTVETAAVGAAGSELTSVEISRRPLDDRLDRDLPMDLVSVIPKRPDLIAGITKVHAYPIDWNGILIALEPDPTRIEPIQLEGYLKEGRLIILAVRGKSDAPIQHHNPESPLIFRLTPDDVPSATPLSASLYTETAVHEWTWE